MVGHVGSFWVEPRPDTATTGSYWVEPRPYTATTGSYWGEPRPDTATNANLLGGIATRTVATTAECATADDGYYEQTLSAAGGRLLPDSPFAHNNTVQGVRRSAEGRRPTPQHH